MLRFYHPFVCFLLFPFGHAVRLGGSASLLIVKVSSWNKFRMTTNNNHNYNLNTLLAEVLCGCNYTPANYTHKSHFNRPDIVPTFALMAPSSAGGGYSRLIAPFVFTFNFVITLLQGLLLYGLGWWWWYNHKWVLFVFLVSSWMPTKDLFTNLRVTAVHLAFTTSLALNRDSSLSFRMTREWGISLRTWE